MASHFTWIPVFKTVAAWLADYEERQAELVGILQAVGIDAGLDDRDEQGNPIPLQEIDPFTFFCMFTKYGVARRRQLFARLIEVAGLQVPPPSDFDGVPTANAMKVWMFPFRAGRKDWMIPTLWKLFRQSATQLDPDTFARALQIPGTGFAKLTEALFYVDPDRYFPIDGQTRPWLEEAGIAIPKGSLSEYMNALDGVREHSDKPFAQLSFDAWEKNQGAPSDAQVAGDHLGQSILSPEPSPAMIRQPLNQILYGPPGTGKTFATIDKALAILDPQFAAKNAGNRAALKSRYDELVAEHRIRFVTFHQSFSYEDFVEGLRADGESGALQYRVEPGVFRSICDDARGSAQVASDIGVREDARIWKISIDGTVVPSQTRNHCFANGEARIGWSAVGDLRSERLVEVPAYASLGTNDRSSLRDFSQEIEPGDVLLCIGSEDVFQAVGVVQGGYEYQQEPPAGVRPDYVNVLPVRWLATGLSLDVRPLNGGRKFTLKTVYELGRFGWPELADYLEGASVKLDGALPVLQTKGLPHVLIIDEVNRGNISRIFGELITLIEPSKRKGEDEALEAVLPYSKKKFSVPNNVYLIGTMNTADRSLAGLDIALRRRFRFEEMPPRPEALGDRKVDGIELRQLLVVLNRRIEVLLGRDYLLGHAYFLGIDSRAGLADAFRRQVLPLLQEYFFEDWQRIAWVLNDQAKPDRAHRFLVREAASPGDVFGPGVDLPPGDGLWRINDAAFDRIESYAGILKAG